MKMGVCYPWETPFMYTACAQSLMNLEHPCDTQFFRGKGWSSARRHLDMCQQAVDWGADLICMLSADQIFPQDLLVKFLDHFNNGYETMSALIPCRGHIAWQDMKPYEPMAWRFKKNADVDIKDAKIRKFRGMIKDPDMIEMVGANQGVQPINFIGSGTLMFHRDHILSLKRPWFYERIKHEDQTRLPVMDTTFSWRLQSEGFAKLWCDTDILIKHLHIFEIDETFQDRFDDHRATMETPEIAEYKELQEA